MLTRERPATFDEDYQRKVAAGYSKMQGYKVAICAIVRDCANRLEPNIQRINQLRKHLDDSRVIIVENDSKDDTKSILESWRSNDKDVHVISEDLGANPLPPNADRHLASFSMHRIGLMAEFRNKYLSALENMSWAPDYVMIIDLDVLDFSIDGIANSFGQTTNWDAVTANGRNFNRHRLDCYYDTYALRELGEQNPQTFLELMTKQNTFASLRAGMPLLAVESAFNGLAIYRAEAIRGLRYDAEENDDCEIKALCEHVSFHRKMARNGYNLIFINPSQVLRYESAPPTKRRKNIFQRLRKRN